ncbi:hypothetical protein VMT65_15330 [Nocardia sp. CDC153]|uniref:hypothetical protein n=1 Tax=Nocardia sp. CDC153 TaxID=3112167 RepID=UPI002DBFAEA9|nr:hypothetical protein [Nocardia sp. CDC153]MEC3954412.1 hypothetical protein [Nocardia sp. CDC153]
MISKYRLIRTGFATLTLVAGLVAVAGPATADTMLTPVSAPPVLDTGSAAIDTGSSNIYQLFNPETGSALIDTGSSWLGRLVYPFYKKPVLHRTPMQDGHF